MTYTDLHYLRKDNESGAPVGKPPLEEDIVKAIGPIPLPPNKGANGSMLADPSYQESGSHRPSSVPPASEKNASGNDGTGAALNKQRVLVVDDNSDAASTLAMLLEFLGAEVQVVNNGESALATLDDYRPNVVLLDIGMPGMDGYAVAQRIRAQHRFDRIVLIALTGWGQEEDRRRTLDSGFDHHMTKPVDINALETLLVSISS